MQAFSWGRLAPPLLVAVVVAIQFAPVLRGRVYRFEDIAGYFEPLWAAAGRAMRAGRLPLWDGGAWSGQPLVGDPQLGAFYPPNWLWCVLPPLRAYAVVVALHALGAGAGMYVLARVRGASRPAAALAGVALGAGGYVVLQTRHVMFVEATAWMPWLVAAGWRYLDRGRPRDLALTAVATGLLLATGGESMIYYGAWFAAAVLVPRALDGHAAVQHDRHTAPQHAAGRLAGLGAAALLGVLLAAPALVPAAAHGALSPRALGADEAFAGSIAWGGLYYMPTLLVPNLLGQEVLGSYRGGGTQWEIAGYYTGVATVALALYALARGPRGRGERFTLGGLMLLCVLLAPGPNGLVHGLACRVLPLYSTMRCPPRALYVLALALPMLAADGLDALGRRCAGRPLLRRRLVRVAPVLVALDLLVTHRAENPSHSLAAAQQAAFPDVVDYLRAHLQPGERYINDVHLRHDLHNSGLLWDLPSAGGYSSLPLWRYLHLLWLSNHGRAYPHARLHDDLAAQGLWRFASPIVDLLGVRYVLAPPGWDPRATGYVKRFTGGDGIDVWENTEAMPRAFLVAGGALPGDDADATARLSREAALPAPVAAARVVSLAPGRLELDIDAPSAGTLLVAEPYHPGWRAEVDNHPVNVSVAAYALIGLPLGAGHHRVALRMTSPAIATGLALWAVGAALLLALVAHGRRRDG